jgi:hypothetical protein
MSADKQQEGSATDSQQQNIAQRQALSDVYSALEAEKTINSFSAFTLEEALDAQIERISGQSTKLRPNVLERVDSMESKLLQAAEQLKATNPEDFVEKNENGDVNTPVEG